MVPPVPGEPQSCQRPRPPMLARRHENVRPRRALVRARGGRPAARDQSGWAGQVSQAAVPGAGCIGRWGGARGVDLIRGGFRSTPLGTPERTCAARARPRCLAHLPSRARRRAFRAAQPSCRRSSASWTDVFMAARQHWRSRSLTALRFAWYWKDHPLSSRLETPHEPPKRCGLTPANLGE